MLRTCLPTAFFVCLGACGTLIGATGCKGSEHVVLAPILIIDDPSPGGSTGGMDGAVPDDGAISNPPDAKPPDRGDAGADSGLDPSIVFEWTETLPGRSGCSPNHYAGSFSCTMEGSPGPVFGQITFDLVGNMGESGLTIANGELTDLVLGALFSADLVGSLHCVTTQFDADTENGMVTLGGSTFMTKLVGQFDPQSQDILGELTMINSADMVCRGAFQVSVTGVMPDMMPGVTP